MKECKVLEPKDGRGQNQKPGDIADQHKYIMIGSFMDGEECIML